MYKIMDVLQSIASMFDEIALWDKRRKLCSNGNVTEKYWKEINSEMNLDGKKFININYFYLFH